MEIIPFSHGIIGEMTENGAGLYYSTEVERLNIYTKYGVHFERTNILEVNPFYNSQNPGFKKTMGSVGIGVRKLILKNYFSNNMSIHFLMEYSIVNSIKELTKGKFNHINNRIISGISLQIPNGKLIKRYDFCFQTSDMISGVFLIRIHFIKKLFY
tara:strand:- start:611 stop:1078 length:468 start_codon:yes stop_codon:yes gene_type:complete